MNRVVLQVAKSAILERFGEQQFDRDFLSDFEFLRSDGASFVTLTQNGNLRGCIGSIIAHRSLFDDIYHNAIAAGFGDPRFDPIERSELSGLTIEVSILTAPEPIIYTDFDDLLEKIEPHKDGLIIKRGIYQGTFLPQVWEQLPTKKEFLEHLAYKAGANTSIYAQNPEIYRYRVEAISDDFDEILPLK